MRGSGSFRLGVNYWPARTAMYWWDDVRVPEVDRDMEQWGGVVVSLAALGG